MDASETTPKDTREVRRDPSPLWFLCKKTAFTHRAAEADSTSFVPLYAGRAFHTGCLAVPPVVALHGSLNTGVAVTAKSVFRWGGAWCPTVAPSGGVGAYERRLRPWHRNELVTAVFVSQPDHRVNPGQVMSSPGTTMTE
ncbi:hypothetical protein J8273_5202 [Carpediemonas membranifera]|uniref:Uncharacterized protein n=1 Tax=Carpediemonas membranifera TaxID=201153 RepID=A0A8J6B3J2_9EUKA|nr:hypothetical protein J8273_5202 [Carpediemonas membranifera]|eukprot:KAG9392219.1 hypothetical protein J8273_5202 [Carpediemonas membranifera]